ncbi:ATP-dependent DNA helicase [Ferruginivarius sediminum]|uniref:ATP-dependent DNA helicase n=1 Tax=Ferruginivarius sediminum TaxID=2661937 RepID=A0A369T994_9PROT|nr:ATP-dependent DNA helicase [Ferruginivarius sediminum]RDD61054.1 ATP-dependent DNA helicase [Ferruginivarius sediminum]
MTAASGLPATSSFPPEGVRLPRAPVLVAGLSGAAWMEADGEVLALGHDDALSRARAEAPVVCHARATARRLGADPFAVFDVLELYAFTRPASFCTPTPRGLAVALGLPLPDGLEAAAGTLHQAARALLAELAARGQRDRDAAGIAWTMSEAGWPWGPAVLSALGFDGEGGEAPRRGHGLRVWERFGEWSETAPEPPAGNQPVSAEEARHRLAELLGEDAEARPQQADYASAVTHAFQPRETPDAPNMVLAEAGTGVGKTLGYIAPASVWSQKNAGPVWLSTYTRNLQHQIDGELDRLFPERREKARRVVVRKGRENYLCLLNLEEAVRGLQVRGQDAVAVGLMARWTAATRDGDMVGGDFPGWLADLLGRGKTLGLTDRRGECIYSACPHYKTCFIEHSIRRARRADIVVANHALVMIQAALGGGDEGRLPSRYVFDEGHHVFDAADSAFSAHLSGREAYELRRWLLGADSRGSRASGRIRGLERRVEDILGGDTATADALHETLRAARLLPAEGWHQRIAEDAANGACEAFLAHVRQQVYARVHRPGDPYSLETELRPVIPPLLESSAELDRALARLLDPMKRLLAGLRARLDDEAEELDSDSRRRIEATSRSLERRGVAQVEAWRQMLAAMQEEESPDAFVDWLMVERVGGRDFDVGLHRHWVDPTLPFAEQVAQKAQGLVVTSATLRDGSGDPEADWQAAEIRTGAVHLPEPAFRAAVPSPFDYPAHTRVFVVNDVRKDDLGQVAAAYRELFLAAGGGALGLFTAISRLRAVHGRIGERLEQAGLPLFAQHVDGLDVSTLVDIFRAEEDGCLLGTDATRDGVDVPGRSLRLIVFDRVPWPRPDIRHKARRELFGKRRYDDMITRLRLKQAYGRLIRRADDRGVFVLLDPMMPSRLTGAFPEGVEVVRCGLADAVAGTRGFLEG